MTRKEVMGEEEQSTLCPGALTKTKQENRITNVRSNTMSDQDKISCAILPTPDRPRTGLITYDAKDPDTKFPPIEQLRPPKGAPNVLIVLIDDAGFGSSSAFGGPCNTPGAERPATGGLKDKRVYTPPPFSPPPKAPLTG